MLLAQVERLEAGKGSDRRAPTLSGAKTDENSLSKQSSQDEAQEKRKRYRRTASEIEKAFACPVQNCDKAYG